MNRRSTLGGLALLAGLLVGCDGNDPDRLNRVGKKLVEKSRRLADDAELPRVTIEKPKKKSSAVVDEKREPEPAARIK